MSCKGDDSFIPFKSTLTKLEHSLNAFEANITFPKFSKVTLSNEVQRLNAPFISVTSLVPGRLKPAPVKDLQSVYTAARVFAFISMLPIFFKLVHPSNMLSIGNVSKLFLFIEETMFPTSSNLSD